MTLYLDRRALALTLEELENGGKLLGDYRCRHCGWATRNREVEAHICSESPEDLPRVRKD